MMEETKTPLAGDEVLQKARTFFAERAPQYGAYLEQVGERHLTFRGRGGEEIAIAVRSEEKGTTVRASSPSYGQAISRFLSTLPGLSEDG